MFTDAELQLSTERRLKYQGTAKISLDQISRHPSATQQLNPRNIERLCEIFREDGCHRFDIQNHVTAVVSRRHLKRARRAARITADDLLTKPPEKNPVLYFPSGQAHCLHGQHRLKAAEKTLAPSERWWTVDLYLDDISVDLRNTLIDEYANEKPPSDGEIYHKIRQYQNEHNAPFQKRWWARLSDNKAKRLRQLMSPDNIDICAAFDALLPIPGLWGGMSIGSLNRVLALKCDEEIVHYLQHVRRFWSTLVNDDRDKMAKIDIDTVEVLQLKAPAASAADARAIKGMILSGEAFSLLTEPERTAIWEKMSTHDACNGIIPSLFTFFRDVNYLEECANGMKQLVELSKGCPTVRAAMKHSFKSDGRRETCPVQTSETAFRSQTGSTSGLFELAYRQLWLFVMRHYPQLARKTTSKKVVAKSSCGEADEIVLYDMAVLSQRLGFESTPVTDLLKCAPDRQIAREALLKARKPGSYRYDADTFESLIDRVVECFASAVAYDAHRASNIVLRGVSKLCSRCGPPRQDMHLLDRSLLFLDRVHAKSPSTSDVVSSFYVRQCVYFAFFGRPSTDGSDQLENRGNDPQSPLFVPVDGYANTSSQNQRRERRRQRREQRDRRRRERRGNVARTSLPAETDIPVASSNADHDTTMRDSVLASSEAENIPSIISLGETGTNVENELAMRDDLAHGPRCSSEPDSEILPEVDYEGQEDQREKEQGEQEKDEQEKDEQEKDEQEKDEQEKDEQEKDEQEKDEQEKDEQEKDEQSLKQLAETESMSVVGDSDYESSYLSESENLNQHAEDLSETSLPLPPGNPSQHQGSARSSRMTVESEQEPLEQESSPTAGIPGETSKQDFIAINLHRPEESPRLASSNQEILEGKDDEGDAAERAVQKALRELEQGAEMRAMAANSEQVPERSASLNDQISEPDESTLAQPEAVTERTGSIERPAVPSLHSDQVIQQGRIARRARAAKAITRFDFTGVNQGTVETTERGQTNQQGPVGPQIALRDKAAAHPEPKGPSDNGENNRKRQRETEGDPDEPVASGQSLGEFTVPPSPEALHPRRRPPPNAITITFKAYENGGWHVTDKVQVDANDTSEAQRIAYKYARKDNQHARFYDKKLRLVSAAQCVRAAMHDGSNTVLMSLWQDLKVTPANVAEVAKMLKADEENQDFDQGIL